MTDKVESIATNTLLIPDIPKCFFGCDDAMLLIHDSFAAYGPIYTFAPMKGFCRLMIIFQETKHAIEAKKELDRHFIIWKDRQHLFPDIITLIKDDPNSWKEKGYETFLLRVYFGQHFKIHTDPNASSLQVPQFQRNLLISPPGSPCEGWEQIEEDAPNQVVLASDLLLAADISDYELDGDELVLETQVIVCSPEQPDHLPAITVQDWDNHIKTDQEIELDSKSKMNSKKKLNISSMVPTAMPPIS